VTHRTAIVAACLFAAAGVLAAAASGAAPSAPVAPAAPGGAGEGSAADAYLLAPKAFRAAVGRVLPSVVRIETYGGVFDPAKLAPTPTRPGSRGRGRPGGRSRRIRAVGRPGEGPTTGLVIASDGYIVTSTFEFADAPPIITVALADGTRHVARLLGHDETRKLCVLKIDVEGLPVPATVGPDDLRVGQWAVSVGVGYGAEDPAISAGIVSATGRVFGRAVQTDANLSPANYGGPLVDIDGRVIGMCVPLSPRGGGALGGVQWYDSGIGFAVPLAGLEDVLEQMKRGEMIRAGRIGVQVAPGGKEGGVGVREIVPDSGAADAGLQKDDVILAFDGQTVRDVTHLRQLVGRHVAGDTVTLTVRRGEEELEIRVTLSAGEDQMPAPRPFNLEGPGRDGGP